MLGLKDGVVDSPLLDPAEEAGAGAGPGSTQHLTALTTGAVCVCVCLCVRVRACVEGGSPYCDVIIA